VSLLERYLEWLEVYVTDNPVTLKTYLLKAHSFLSFLEHKGVKLEELDEEILFEYMKYLKVERKLKSQSIQPHVRGIRNFLRFIGREDIASRVKYPRHYKASFRLPPKEVVYRIIDDIERLDVKTIIAILFDTGLRISEALSLRACDVEERDGYFRLYVYDTKNGEPRMVFVRRFYHLLKTYLETTKPEGQEYLFPNRKNPSKPLHPAVVERILREKGKKFGVRVYPHLLRHMAATIMLSEGLDVEIVRRLLGHKSMKMIEVYVNLSQRQVEELVIRKSRENSKTEKICTRCWTRNPPDAKYCYRCGAPLDSIEMLRKEDEYERAKRLATEFVEIVRQNPEAYFELLRSLRGSGDSGARFHV